ncbi:MULTISPECIES: CPBP family intramembrane glutamic endopeptidase [unclassified Leucobacter]|uniref:CPBP family intramembrane glutamic endopeptidase n=1 Tax=unclassified Leucobacter TaxID=2621730 RepID=UPI00165D69D0|nr:MULTISPECIES: type II CAAX endopeptidase family protein [unclassified Leucobacter]MBC9928590.1 CPBP family intramembrane metalloprotease [Leucobacter sp. cx-169]
MSAENPAEPAEVAVPACAVPPAVVPPAAVADGPVPPAPGTAPGERVRWGAVTAFVLIACGLAWLAILPVWLNDGDFATFGGVLPVVMMYTPALATLVVVYAMRAPANGRARYLGLWPLRPAKRVIWFSVAAIFGPLVLIAVGILLSAAFGLAKLDLVGFSGFSGFAALLSESVPPELMSSLPPMGVLVVTQLIMIPVGAVFNIFATFGEEIGWRGWLLPALRPLGVWPALIISGVIWGLWHSPMILLGYNFARTDWTGVAFMVGGCVAWGVLLGWTRLRTGSVWPAVFAHGALNAGGGAILLFAMAGAPLDLAIVGPIGVVAWGVVAVAVVVLVLTGQFRQEPALAGPRRGVAPAAPSAPAETENATGER